MSLYLRKTPAFWSSAACCLQVRPPSLVASTTPRPPPPTTQPWSESTKSTALMSLSVLAFAASWVCQLAPPSLVATIIGGGVGPKLETGYWLGPPTAQTWEASLQATSVKDVHFVPLLHLPVPAAVAGGEDDAAEPVHILADGPAVTGVGEGDAAQPVERRHLLRVPARAAIAGRQDDGARG